MFNRELKLEVLAIKNTVVEMMHELSKLQKDYKDFLEWKKMRDANEKAAATLGHFYITADDTAMLEKLIQEVNKDPDLAVLMTTAQGTTLSLRSHPQPQKSIKVTNYNKFTEDEE